MGIKESVIRRYTVYGCNVEDNYIFHESWVESCLPKAFMCHNEYTARRVAQKLNEEQLAHERETAHLRALLLE